ncbi:retinoic acid receptor responder protein 1 [Ctenodactylus gundi]
MTTTGPAAHGSFRHLPPLGLLGNGRPRLGEPRPVSLAPEAGERQQAWGPGSGEAAPRAPAAATALASPPPGRPGEKGGAAVALFARGRRRPPRAGSVEPAPAAASMPPRLLLLLLLLALQGPAMPAPLWRRPDRGLPGGVLQQAARAALHFLNFRLGSPSALRVLVAVQEGRAWIEPQKGCKADLVFSTELLHPEEGKERFGKCSAQVHFKNQKPRPSINITCTRSIEKEERQQKDYLLYKQMKQFKNSLDTITIPDSHGHIDPSLRPIWSLAFLGSSYVMWEMTNQFVYYYLVQLTSVKQWKTDADAIDFDYTVLLHEFSTQEIIPCRIHLVWYPGKPPKVNFQCGEPQTSEEASGTVEGSAVAPTEFNNF